VGEKTKMSIRYNKSSKKGVRSAYVFLFISFAATFFAWLQARDFLNQLRIEKFNIEADETEAIINDVLKSYVDALYSARALFAASKTVERNEWNAYINLLSLEERFQGVHALSYLKRVPLEEKENFIKRVQGDTSLSQEGYPDFDVYPEGDREEYIIVTFIEPFEKNKAAFGFDLFSNPSRKAGLERARDENTPIATAPIRLMQETGEQAGFLLFLPVYENGTSIETIEEKQAALIGYISAVFRAGDLLHSILKNIRAADNLHVEVYDTFNPSENNVLFQSHQSNVFSAPILSTTRKADIGSRSWAITFTNLSKSDIGFANRLFPATILTFGLLFSLFTSYILYSSARIRERAIILAQDLTTDLNKFQMAVEGTSEHIMFTDADGSILYANKAAEMITGFSRNEMIGNSSSMLRSNIEKESFPEFWETIKQKKGLFIGEINNKTKSGSEYTSELRISPIIDKTENVRFFVFVERDITEKKRIENMKSDFVSIVSHQLKTPIAQMRGYIDNMLSGISGELTEKQSQYLLEMEQVSARYFRLISDLLNISMIERGIISMTIEPFPIREIIYDVIKEHQALAESKGISIEFNQPNNSIVVDADKDRVREVLNNVIRNAIKFTNEGSITFTIKSDDKFGIVEVADTGIGIPEDLQSQLFKKRQVFSGAPVAGASVRLGLYIAKCFMKEQQGDIRAFSAENKGSTFIVNIPLSKAL
jgi:PAS domain S-box-containing protein